ncbi:hypothetical protein D3C77_309880 [compost metagenome]
MFQRRHLYIARAMIVLTQAVMQASSTHPGRQQARLQGNGQGDALTVAAIAGHEHRPLRQTGMLLDLRHMLVIQVQAIHQHPLRRLHARCFVTFDRCTAATGIPRDGIDGQWVISWHQPCGHQGSQQGNRAGGIATRVADPLGLGDSFGLLLVQFRQAIHPACGGAVRGAGIDHPDLRVGDRRHRLACGVVGQAQNRHIGTVDRLGAALWVFALAVGQGQQTQVIATVQAGVDEQAGGALVAIDKD